MSVLKYQTNYQFDDHTSIPFKLINLNPSPNFDKGVEAHRHNYYELFVFETGGGKHLIDFKTYSVNNHSIHIVPPGSVHLLKRGKQTKGYVLLFSRDFYALNLQTSQFANFEQVLANFTNRHQKQSPIFFNTIINIVNQIENELLNKHINTNEIIRAYLNILILNLQHFYQANNKGAITNSNHEKDLFLRLIEKNFTQQKQVSFYAQQLNLHPDKLNLICKTSLGKNASTIIKERICLEIKRLLMHSNLTIKEISYFLGFEDTAYFSRYVKKNLNKPPIELKRELCKVLKSST